MKQTQFTHRVEAQTHKRAVPIIHWIGFKHKMLELAE